MKKIEKMTLLQIIEDKDVTKIGEVIKIGDTIISPKRGEYDTPYKITDSFLNLFIGWRLREGEEDCKFCKIRVHKENGKFNIEVADHFERSPASLDFQLQLNKFGFFLLHNQHPWQLIQEILILKRHTETIYELLLEENVNTFKFTFDCWFRYIALKEKIENFVNTQRFWLTMFTNDRLGATIPHFHSQPGLSINPPQQETSLKRVGDIFAETNDFYISTFPGRNNQIVSVSKEPCRIMNVNKEDISKQLGLIRVTIISLFYEMFKGPMPVNEGLFSSMTDKDHIIHVMIPYSNEGAPQKLFGLNYYSGTPALIAKKIRNYIVQLKNYEELKNKGLEIRS